MNKNAWKKQSGMLLLPQEHLSEGTVSLSFQLSTAGRRHWSLSCQVGGPVLDGPLFKLGHWRACPQWEGEPEGMISTLLSGRGRQANPPQCWASEQQSNPRDVIASHRFTIQIVIWASQNASVCEHSLKRPPMGNTSQQKKHEFSTADSLLLGLQGLIANAHRPRGMSSLQRKFKTIQGNKEPAETDLQIFQMQELPATNFTTTPTMFKE